MHLFHKLNKKFIAGFQILFVRHSFLIFRGIGIFMIALCQYIPAVFNNYSIMRINVIIILNVVFVIGRRYKNWIKV